MQPHPDFRDLLAEFAREGVRYLLVGGYAVSFHGRPRSTKDIDLWLSGSGENLARAARALERFGAPADIARMVAALGPTDVVFMGAPPVRVDLLRTVDGLEDFEEAYRRRVEARWGEAVVSVIGLDDLIANKRAAGHAQDQIDTEALERVRAGRGAGRP